MSNTSRYNDSIRARISWTYSSIYIFNSFLVLAVFAAVFAAYTAFTFNSQAAEAGREVAGAVTRSMESGTLPERFRVVELYPIAAGRENLAIIFIYDANTGDLLEKSDLSVSDEPYAQRREANFLFRVLPQLTRLADGFYVTETLEEAGQTGLRVVMYWSVGPAQRQLWLALRIIGACCPLGLFLFTWVGKTRTESMLEPIARISSVAKRINGDNLSLRIDESSSKYELNELVTTINGMMDRIQSSYDNQKRFVSDVSHELRTPISVISGYANMLKRWGKDDSEILEESINAIHNEADAMKDLVEKLLFLARHDNETLRFEFEPTDVSRLLMESAKEALLVHDEFVFGLNVAENLEAVVDPQRIKQLFRILIDNSVKYSTDDKHVEVSLAREGDSIVFSIKDRGVGISKEDLPRIFERFYRADESRAKTTGGYGLGLPMAEIIVRGHKGSITVRSKLNRGTEFIIRLPVSGGTGSNLPFIGRSSALPSVREE